MYSILSDPLNDATLPRCSASTIRPIAPLVLRQNIPEALRSCNQWVVWRYELRNEKWTKVPYFALTGGSASTTDPTTWVAFEVAYNAYVSSNYDGIGFVFGDADDFAGIDLDDCIDPDADDIADMAAQIVDAFGSYAEVSPSQTGLKIFVRGQLPKGMRRPAPGWNGELDNADFVDQNYQLSYSTAAQPNVFIPLGTYALNNGFSDNPGGHQVTLQIDLAGTLGGVIASNAAHLQFQFSAANGASNWAGDATAYREIEVFGTAATPEPSTLILCGLGAVGLLIAARRRKA